ncbi:MAG: tetratricopeptide repeat protein [Bacteroidia bacterium]
MSFFHLLLNKTIHYFPARFAFITKPEVVPNLEMAEELKELFIENRETHEPSQDFDVAVQLMESGAYQDCIEVYGMIAQKYPEMQGLCECQIGAAYFFMKKYEQALDFYLRARSSGMDPEMMDDNIWEVCALQYDLYQQNDYLEKYLRNCPNGKYSDDAMDLLLKGKTEGGENDIT